MKTLSIREFIADDFTWLQAWYQDPLLNEELGPLDHAWLDHVLTDKGGKQYCIFAGSEPIAVIGTVWAKHPQAANTLSDIAVNPMFRGQGLGASALNLMLDHTGLTHWVAYVCQDNIRAQHFFTKNGWQSEEPSASDGMLVYLYQSDNG